MYLHHLSKQIKGILACKTLINKKLTDRRLSTASEITKKYPPVTHKTLSLVFFWPELSSMHILQWYTMHILQWYTMHILQWYTMHILQWYTATVKFDKYLSLQACNNYVFKIIIEQVWTSRKHLFPRIVLCEERVDNIVL